MKIKKNLIKAFFFTSSFYLYAKHQSLPHCTGLSTDLNARSIHMAKFTNDLPEALQSIMVSLCNQFRSNPNIPTENQGTPQKDTACIIPKNLSLPALTDSVPIAVKIDEKRLAATKSTMIKLDEAPLTINLSCPLSELLDYFDSDRVKNYVSNHILTNILEGSTILSQFKQYSNNHPWKVGFISFLGKIFSPDSVQTKNKTLRKLFACAHVYHKTAHWFGGSVQIKIQVANKKQFLKEYGSPDDMNFHTIMDYIIFHDRIADKISIPEGSSLMSPLIVLTIK